MPTVPATPPPLLDALLVDRDRLVRVLRITLEELNIRRVTTTQCTGEMDINEMLRYWEEVFGWIKHQGATEIVMMSRRP